MIIALAGPFDLAIVIVVIAFATFVLMRGQRSVHAKLGAVELTVNEVANAVNNVAPDEGKLIDQVRDIKKQQTDLARVGNANHLSMIAMETTVVGFGERLTAIGMKADSASVRADTAYKMMADYIAEQNIIESAASRGLLDRRRRQGE